MGPKRPPSNQGGKKNTMGFFPSGEGPRVCGIPGKKIKKTEKKKKTRTCLPQGFSPRGGTWFFVESVRSKKITLFDRFSELFPAGKWLVIFKRRVNVWMGGGGSKIPGIFGPTKVLSSRPKTALPSAPLGASGGKAVAQGKKNPRFSKKNNITLCSVPTSAGPFLVFGFFPPAEKNLWENKKTTNPKKLSPHFLA